MEKAQDDESKQHFMVDGMHRCRGVMEAKRMYEEDHPGKVFDTNIVRAFVLKKECPRSLLLAYAFSKCLL
jgi:hypothetical protein